jgi:protoporphyrinogen/coproporphyrinogen III oxidase
MPTMATSNKHLKSIIVGGGISGLCAGEHLSRVWGKEAVSVLEADSEPGGYARTDKTAGFLLDWGPNGFLSREPLMLEWIADLGISHRLIEANQNAARRFIVRGGRLIELVPPPRFLLSPALSVRGRLRLLWEPMVPQRQSDAPESIWDFAARRIGPEAADFLVSPMVSGVFGGNAAELSLAHAFPRMAAMEREHGSLFKALKAKKKENPGATPMGPGGTLTTFDEGIAVLGTTAAQQLGGAMSSGVKALRAELTDAKGFRVFRDDDETIESEGLVIATPPHAAAPLLAEIAPEAAKALASIKCCNITVVCTAYPREKVGHNMEGFGFLIPRKEGMRSLGCIWTSSVFPHQAPEGWVLLRTMIGGASDPEAVDLSDEELLAVVTKEIHPLLRIDGGPELVQVFRHRHAIPQYGLDHDKILTAVAEAERALPGLVFAGNAYRGVGLNDCVVSAVRAVRHLEDALAVSDTAPR